MARDSYLDRVRSFRTRLRLFFVLIVIVPVLLAALIVFKLIADSQRGQADARIAARQGTAQSFYEDQLDRADRAASRIGRDQGLADALRDDDEAAVRRAVTRLLPATDARRIVLTDPQGGELADVGNPDATFPATRRLVADGRTVATLEVSVARPDDFAALVGRVTGLQAIVRRGDEVLASTLDGTGGTQALPPERGEVSVDGREFRVTSFAARGFGGEALTVTLLEPGSRVSGDIRDARLLAAAILAGFLLLAALAAALVSRSLQRQIGEFLTAARRLGGGDFSAKVPTRGRDQFAQLGHEFNTMAEQLEARLEELSQERRRLELSLRRLGETFASNLDRDALLEIVVRTSVDAIDADGGRAALLGGNGRSRELRQVARAGDVGTLSDAVDEAERRALAGGTPALLEIDGAAALAHPLRAGPAAGDDALEVTGLVSVWRTGRSFSEAERELFHYLAGQVAQSLENVGLHETVERQAVTDELTGLSNRRRFDDTMAAEVERSRRFGQEVGLVLLDIDDFKAVNDTYGHQQGDVVLKEVARVLLASTREVDEPARYGGEELAVILPGTGLDGAYDLAERVRRGIQRLAMPLDDGGTLRVTASFGVAAVPAAADDLRSLVAAADEALYEAKRTGKNRTVRTA